MTIPRTAIAAKNLTFCYSHRTRRQQAEKAILDNLTMEIQSGEFTGILGPNGSGKTTLLRNILRYLESDRGTISVYERSQRDYSARELAEKMSLVPQKSGGGASLSVHEMILLGRLVHLENRWEGFSALDHSIVDHVIDVLDLNEFRDRRCHTLSGGEFQKVLLARALVQQSSILLLDEATASLDLRHATEIMDMVRRQTGSGKTVIAVMHDLNLAARYCDRVILLKNGRVRYSGSPAEVYQRAIIREIYEIDAYISADDEGIPFVLPKCKAFCGEQQMTKEVV
ncbi:ABC transporter ATP-binding protein [Marispirochaeta sp.]|uniref:ABC transporter ATP-binding protein n=1 Tax=Marispirochaeta sp. TaxID=2038653 RepID=UPI0029C80A0C|nr:ABC transporter ATP-binding protein [Marispirochaeta sp.]